MRKSIIKYWKRVVQKVLANTFIQHNYSLHMVLSGHDKKQYLINIKIR